MRRTKMVDGKELTAEDFAFVGDPEDMSTWKLPMHDADHARNALARFNQTDFPDAEAKKGAARKLLASAKRFGIDASGFADEQGLPWKAQESLYVGAFPASFIAEESKSGGEADGWEWPVQILKAGEAGGTLTGADGAIEKKPHYFTAGFVAEMARAAEGARFGRRHPRDDADVNDQERVAGWFSDSHVLGEAARAKLHLLRSEGQLREKLLAAREAKKLDLFGLSFCGIVAFAPAKVDGKEYLVSQRLGRLITVDMVTEAGAGGEFLVAASKSLLAQLKDPPASSGGRNGADASATAVRKSGGAMKEKIMKVIEALRKFAKDRADALQKELEGVPEEKLGERFDQVVDAYVECSTGAFAKVNAQGGDPEVLKQIREGLEEAKKLQSANLIERLVVEAKLPKPAENLVREHLKDQVVTAEQVHAEVKSVREAFAAYADVGKVSRLAALTVGRDSEEKIQVAMDKLFGVKEALKDNTVAAFRGIREAYQVITGDRDLSELPAGGFYRVSEVMTTATFPAILRNSMTKRLLQDYAEVGMGGLEQLIAEADVDDFKTQDRVRLGYLGDLPVVAENAAYLEITAPTDDLVQYAVAKRGGFLDITWETIVNDDLGKISQFPTRLARSARRTLKQFITDFFVNNPAYDPDTLAWFVAGHSNLGSLALSSAELDARAIALAKQTEKDSAKRLGVPLDWIMVPVDLYPTARQINRNDTGTNGWYQMFGAREERIIRNELLADVNDWYYGALPSNAPFLEIGYLRGFRTPQIFIVPVERRREITAIDKVQMYGIYVFGGDIVDFRPVGKNVVP